VIKLKPVTKARKITYQVAEKVAIPDSILEYANGDWRCFEDRPLSDVANLID